MPNDERMGYRRLGRAGVRVSRFGLGGWLTFGGSVQDEKLAESIIRMAFERGINFFDIADVYAKGEAERLMGQILRSFPRNELVISSKLFWPVSADINDRGLSRKHIMESIERSLRRIGTDYLDIYFCHRFDPDTPLDETCRAMDDLIRQGKVLYWGTSEWTGAQLRDAGETCRSAGFDMPRVEQPQYSLLERAKVESDVAPAARELGMGLVTWSPLASGVLSGKYDEGVPAGTRLAGVDWLRESALAGDRVERVRRMKAVADGAGCSRAQLALAWTAAQPGISSVILGATSEEQMEENLGALDVTITPDLARALDDLFPAG